MGNIILDLRIRTKVDQYSVDKYIARDIPEILTRPLPPSVAVARVVQFNERGGKAQQEWIAQLVADSPASAVSENYIASVSSVQRNYDVLLVSGNDPRRINKLLRLYRPILGDKAKIAVLAHGNPGERAALLNGGYDDVFDLRTSVTEARCRLLAHVRRYHHRRIADAGRSMQRLEGDRNGRGGQGIGRYFKQVPTPVEAAIFARLARSPGRPVPCEELCVRPPDEGAPLNRRSLQVFVCRIRKKLMPGLAVTFSGNGGYLVSFTERTMEMQEIQ